MLRKWTTLISLLCGALTCSLLSADDLDPESSAYLSDKKYAKHIEVKAYIVTKDQVAKVFSGENVKVSQKTNKELYGQEIYLLLRCKNKGDYRSFGTLNCRRSNSGNAISIEIMMMPGYMKSFRDSVLPLYSGSIPNDNNTPVITFEWKSLYTI